MRSKVRRIRQKVVSADRPFFPGYLFVQLDLQRDPWRSVNGTIGVVRLVGFGSSGGPAPLPMGFVERLQDMSEERHLDSEELTTGDAVRIVGGPFDDLCGTLERASDSERVIVLLSLLGKDTRVQIRRRYLLAA